MRTLIGLLVVYSALPGCRDAPARQAATAPAEGDATPVRVTHAEAASAAHQSTAVSDETGRSPRDRYWWVEINSLAGEYYTRPVESFRVIAGWATPIATTRAHQIERLYPRLAEDLPGVPIIGGVKLSDFVGLDGEIMKPEGWRELGACLGRIAELTGQRIVVIEAEGPMKHWDANQVSDEDLLGFVEAAARHLPGEDALDEIWWWPAGVFGTTPYQWMRYVKLQVALHAADGRFRFITNRRGGKWDAYKPDATARQKRSGRIANVLTGDPVDIFYVGPTYESVYGERHWTTEEGKSLGAGIYYPGWTNCLDVAREIIE